MSNIFFFRAKLEIMTLFLFLWIIRNEWELQIKQSYKTELKTPIFESQILKMKARMNDIIPFM